jgi:hypothetical protein
MIADALRMRPGLISLLALVAGFLLIATGQLPLGAVGIALFVLAVLVPFLRVAAETDRDREMVKEPATDVPSPAEAVQVQRARKRNWAK